jgi:PST family polysaccharide transporter
MSAPPDNLSRRATHAAAWTLMGGGLRQLVGVGLSIALRGLLDKNDFGVVAIIMSLVAIANELRDPRLNDALIQRKELTEADLRTAFAGTVLGGLAASLLLAAITPAVAAFYGNRQLVWLGLALAAGPFLESWGGVSRALLTRNLKHKWIAAAELIALIVGGGVAVTMAATGSGPWALVAFNLTGSCVATLLVILMARWVPRPGFAADSLRSLWGFSSYHYGALCMGQVGRNVDKLVVGKIGAAILGAYTLAFQLMMLPVEQVAWPIGRVMLPTLSQLQDDPERMRRAFLRAVRLLGLVTFPISAGLFVTAEEFTRVVYGEKYLEMVPILRILCAAGFVGTIASSIGWVFFTLGETKKEFYWTLAQTVGLTIGALLGAPWGACGVAFGIVAATFLFSAIGFRIALRLIGLTPGEFLRALFPTAIAALVMILLLEGALLALFIQVGKGWLVPDAALLAGEVIAGALIYGGCLWVTRAEAWRDGLQLAREFLQKTART